MWASQPHNFATKKSLDDKVKQSNEDLNQKMVKKMHRVVFEEEREIIEGMRVMRF